MRTTKIKQPLVYVIILSFNGKDNLEMCIPSVMSTDYSNLKVVVVDNASKDGSADFAETFAGVKVVRNKKNRYWGPANNQGIKIALADKADYIVLLNDDVVVDKRWIKEAVNVCEKDPLIGFIEFDLMNPVTYGDMGEFKRRSKNFKNTLIKPIKNVTGCSLFSTASLYKNIGLIDEGFPLYMEETDLARRAKKAGYKLMLINVPVFHAGMKTSGKIKKKAALFEMISLMRCVIKNDNIFEIIKMLLFIMNAAFNPVKKVKGDMFLERLRPMNPIFNIFIFIPAMLYDIIMLPEIMAAKYRDYKKIKNARKALYKLKKQ